MGFSTNLKIFENSICLSYENLYIFENCEKYFFKQNKNFKWALV